MQFLDIQYESESYFISRTIFKLKIFSHCQYTSLTIGFMKYDKNCKKCLSTYVNIAKLRKYQIYSFFVLNVVYKLPKL